jgi:hypothetical protein
MDNKLVYIKSTNKKGILVFNRDLNSLRCRQRNRNSDGSKVTSMKFVSFREMEKEKIKNELKISGPYNFYTMSRL